MQAIVIASALESGVLVQWLGRRWRVQIVSPVTNPPDQVGLNLVPVPAEPDITTVIIICDQRRRFVVET